MKISQIKAIRQDWDKTKSWNYKLKHLDKYKSVVYAEIIGNHGEVSTDHLEWVYYIIEGDGEFDICGEITQVTKRDVITVPPNMVFNYRSLSNKVMRIVLFMELWDN